MPIEAIVAEDEPLLRAELRHLLRKAWPELEIVAEAQDGGEALEALQAHSPQVLFLDIQMPGVSGLEVARAAGGRAHVVFVTAFSQFAVQAFENEAVDFIVKPVTEERLRLTIERLKRRLAAPPRSLEAILRKIESTFEHPKREPLRWITASQGKQTRLVMIDEVVYFQSDHKYTRVVTADEELLIRTPIRQLGEELDPARFRQVHRSTIVNLACVRALEREDARAVLRLKNRDETLVVSEAYLPLFRQM